MSQSPEPRPDARWLEAERLLRVTRLVTRPRVLVAEGDAALRARLVRGLRRDGCDVIESTGGADLVEHLVETGGVDVFPLPDLLLCELDLPDGGPGLLA